jgi:hypothetical protein
MVASSAEQKAASKAVLKVPHLVALTAEKRADLSVAKTAASWVVWTVYRMAGSKGDLKADQKVAQTAER